VGLEWDAAACATAKAAGHARIRTDVAAYPTDAFGTVEGFISSPPCQAWSMAGNRKGELDRANCHRLADRMADGDDSLDWTEWEDPRSHLVSQPVRWVRDLRPEWVALEEVPAVLGLWEHFARIFRGWGYSVWTGVLCAADYGVPQTRVRAILMASRVATVHPPLPTHAEDPQGADLFGGRTAKWVSMAEALGWGMTDRPAFTICALPGGKSTGAEWGGASVREAMRDRMGSDAWSFVAAGVTGEGRPKDARTQPADTITGKGTAYWVYRASNQAHAARQPAPTVVFGQRSNKVEWMPAETAHDPSARGIRVTPQEAGVLQSFPAEYPWQGNQSKRHEQVGNAIPPMLAAHILAALGAGELPSERAA
jgi:DNA (cytosine-5)-methyltransferase 1